MSAEVRLPHFREDGEIERDVLAELELEQDVADQTLVEVGVDDGVVLLTGFAGSLAQKCAIERAVGRVVGVRDVRDYLEVRPPGNDYREDRRIEHAARCAIEWDARVPDGIRAEVTDGVVRLAGTVERFSQREDTSDAVRNLIGVRDIVNEIVVTPAPLAADLSARVEAAIRRRFGAECRGVCIAVVDGRVTLGGVVPKYVMIDDVERAVRSVPGIRRVDNQLLVG